MCGGPHPWPPLSPFLWASVPEWTCHSWGALETCRPPDWHASLRQQLQLMGTEICRRSSYLASTPFSSSSHGNRLQGNWARGYLYPVWGAEVCLFPWKPERKGMFFSLSGRLHPHTQPSSAQVYVWAHVALTVAVTWDGRGREGQGPWRSLQVPVLPFLPGRHV